MTVAPTSSMARHQSALTNWSQYIAARMAAMALMMFDVEPDLRAAARLGRWLYRFDHRHRTRATQAIATSFPQLPPNRVRAIVRGSFEHFVQLVVETCYTPRLLHHDSWARHVTFTNLGPAVELLNAGSPVILLTGHVGNWELLGYLMALLG